MLLQSKTRLISKPAFWLASGIVTLLITQSLVTKTSSTLIALSIIGLILFTWKKPHLILYGIVLLPTLGEFGRISYITENGIPISDLVIGIFIGVWLLKKILQQKPLAQSPFKIPLFLFLLAGIISLFQSLLFLKPAEVVASSFYLIRFIEYGLLALSMVDILKSEKQKRTAIIMMVISTGIIAIAGFIQLIIYPDLGKLVEFGWDPHRNRLVSTWLDPNFVGGLLAFMSMILIGLTFYVKGLKKYGLIFIIAFFSIALFLTYSRSAYLAFASGIIVISLLKSRKLLIMSILIALIGISLSTRAQERTGELYQSITSFIMNTNQNPDPTARLRIQSWQQTLDLIGKRPLFGSGYNTLRYTKFQEGFVEDTGVHSASGSDSSMLTILATTGVFGFIPFCLLYFKLLKTAWKNYRTKQTKYIQGFGLGIFAATISILTHSFFVNSLLFPQIMIFVWISAGLLQPLKNMVNLSTPRLHSYNETGVK